MRKKEQLRVIPVFWLLQVNGGYVPSMVVMDIMVRNIFWEVVEMICI